MTEPRPVTAESLGAAIDRLEASRPALRARPAREIASVLGKVGVRFRDASDPLRVEALAALPAASGLSPRMAEAVLDGMARDWDEASLLALLTTDLGEPNPLDGFVDRGEPDAPTARSGSRVMAVGPRLAAQFVAGSVPGVGVNALLRSLLVKSPTLLKPGRGDDVLPGLFARGLAEADAELAEALVVLYWPGGEEALEAVALGRADLVTVYGSDETVRALRARTPVTTRFVPYHHRISLGLVGREALNDAHIERTASELAEAVAMFDRRGCVSPQMVFVESGGPLTASDFADRLAAALSSIEDTLPSGPRSAAEASSLHQVRGTAEMLASVRGGRIVHGREQDWTVVLSPGGEAAVDEASGATGRFLVIREASDASEVPSAIAPLGPHLQSVGVAGLGDRVDGLARALGEIGVSRVAPLASMPFPPPTWLHDGRGPLRALVRWIELEGR